MRGKAYLAFSMMRNSFVLIFFACGKEGIPKSTIRRSRRKLLFLLQQVVVNEKIAKGKVKNYTFNFFCDANVVVERLGNPLSKTELYANDLPFVSPCRRFLPNQNILQFLSWKREKWGGSTEKYENR